MDDTEAWKLFPLVQGCTERKWQKLGPGLEAWQGLKMGHRLLPPLSQSPPLHWPLHVAEAEPPSAVSAGGPGPATRVPSCYCDTQLGPIYWQAVVRESGALGPYACPSSDLLYDLDQIPSAELGNSPGSLSFSQSVTPVNHPVFLNMWAVLRVALTPSYSKNSGC